MKKRALKITTIDGETLFHGTDYSTNWKVGHQLICSDGTKRRINNISATNTEVTVIVQSNATSTKIESPVLIEALQHEEPTDPAYAEFKQSVKDRQKAIEDQRLHLWRLEEELKSHLSLCPHHEQTQNKKHHSGDYLSRSYTEKITSCTLCGKILKVETTGGGSHG